MGQGSSASASLPPRKMYPSKRYLWNDAALARAISAGFLAPLGDSTADPAPGRGECQICYRFYTRINRTKCCGEHICTECVSVIAAPPPEKSVCPFCRREHVSVEVVNGDQVQTKDDMAFLKFEERRRQGLEDSHLQDQGPPLTEEQEQLVQRIVARTGISRYMVSDLVRAGLDEEEIVSNIIG